MEPRLRGFGIFATLTGYAGLEVKIKLKGNLNSYGGADGIL